MLLSFICGPLLFTISLVLQRWASSGRRSIVRSHRQLHSSQRAPLFINVLYLRPKVSVSWTKSLDPVNRKLERWHMTTVLKKSAASYDEHGNAALKTVLHTGTGSRNGAIRESNSDVIFLSRDFVIEKKWIPWISGYRKSWKYRKY